MRAALSKTESHFKLPVQKMPSTPTKPQAPRPSSPIKTPLKISQSSAPPKESPLSRTSPRRRAQQEEEERLKARQEMAKRRQDSKTALLSPAAEDSPKAESPSIKRTTSGLSTSLSSDAAAFSPATSRANLAMRSSASTFKLNPTAQVMTVEQMTKSFEEWMKMAADNKINSKNSWSFALIDYFSELTFLRDGDSINFQKASCTLDGCVKIYASRVDSVVDETTKLLNGLTDKKFTDDSSASTIDANDGEEGEDSTTKAKSRKSTRLVETIEKNPEALCLKNFDLEFSIDPLFKKTSAEFDEGNNRGTLLKSLEVSPIDNLVIFDSSDKIPIEFGVFEEGEEQGEFELDISQIQQNFGSALIDLTAGKSLCPTFEDYSFTALSDMSELMDRLSHVTAHIPQNDYVVAEAEEEDNYFEAANFDDGFEDYNEPIAEERAESPAQKHVSWSKDTDNDETGLSYFDAAMKQTWAGPEHWKVRRSARVAQASQESSATTTSSASSSTQSSRRASKQEKPAINFATAEVDLRSVFAKPPSSASITLGKAAILERNESKHLLPDDLHFTSANLLKLFIKPEWKLNRSTSKDDSLSRRSSRLRQSYSAAEAGVNGNFVDRDYWLSQDHERKEGVFEAYHQAIQADQNEADDGDDSIGLLDDYDDYDAFPSVAPLTITDFESQKPAQFSQQMVAAPRFTFAPQLNYARVAKRVDIAKLKATLWQDFLDNTNAVKQKESPIKKHLKMENNDSSNTFSHLISNLSKSYPTEALAEVSVPYCFICLLHLANENNLEIKPTDSDLIILN